MKREGGQLIERCWNSDATKRPSIGEVWHILKQMRFDVIEGIDCNYIHVYRVSRLPMGSVVTVSAAACLF
jgi:hypothetical protein